MPVWSAHVLSNLWRCIQNEHAHTHRHSHKTYYCIKYICIYICMPCAINSHKNPAFLLCCSLADVSNWNCARARAYAPHGTLHPPTYNGHVDVCVCAYAPYLCLCEYVWNTCCPRAVSCLCVVLVCERFWRAMCNMDWSSHQTQTHTHKRTHWFARVCAEVHGTIHGHCTNSTANKYILYVSYVYVKYCAHMFRVARNAHNMSATDAYDSISIIQTHTHTNPSNGIVYARALIRIMHNITHNRAPRIDLISVCCGQHTKNVFVCI